MFVKLAVIASILTLSASYDGPSAGAQPASLYPAGVDPKACPNYPLCSNPAVAVNQVPAQQYYQPQQYGAHQPQYSQPQPQYYQPQPQYNQPEPQYTQPQPQYYQSQNQPQYNSYPVNTQQYAPVQHGQYSSDVQERLNRGEYIGDGDYHGEGLAEALAPEYQGPSQAYNAPQSYNPAPQYNPYNTASAYNAAPSPQYNYNYAPTHAQPAQIPAGVDPSSCPNYPFCH